MNEQVQPTAFRRRSFVYRKLVEAGARFREGNDAAVAMDFGSPEGESATLRRMGLVDLSPLPRIGFKGAGTADWLAAQGVAVPRESNRAERQADGGLAPRLAPGEVWVLSGLNDEDRPDALLAAWNAEPLPPETPRGFPLPRGETHAWFRITGSESAAMFAKVGGVDLRPAKFPDGGIAQTSVARLNCVIVRDDLGDTLAFHLLCDSASAMYLWGCLLDAMAEFEGAPIGLTALRGAA